MLALVDGANWAEILLALATLVAASGLFFAGAQIRVSRQTETATIVRELAQHWECDDMVEARQLVYSHGFESQGIDDLKNAIKEARDGRLPSYFIYTRWVNFFEQIGLSFNNHRRGIRVVDSMFGSTICSSWIAWRIVIPHVWGFDSQVGKNFGILARKLERRHHQRYIVASFLRTIRLSPTKW